MPSKKSAPKTITTKQAEKMTKAAARKRQIIVRITDEQMALFAKEYGKLNPAEAAELVFIVGKRPVSKLKLAGYSYAGDTCCV